MHYQYHVIKTKQDHNITCGTHSEAVMFPKQGIFRVTIILYYYHSGLNQIDLSNKVMKCFLEVLSK